MEMISRDYQSLTHTLILTPWFEIELCILNYDSSFFQSRNLLSDHRQLYRVVCDMTDTPCNN